MNNITQVLSQQYQISPPTCSEQPQSQQLFPLMFHQNQQPPIQTSSNQQPVSRLPSSTKDKQTDQSENSQGIQTSASTPPIRRGMTHCSACHQEKKPGHWSICFVKNNPDKEFICNGKCTWYDCPIIKDNNRQRKKAEKEESNKKKEEEQELFKKTERNQEKM